MPTPEFPRERASLTVWWLVWGGLLTGLVLIYAGLGRGPVRLPPAGAHPLTGLIGFLPLFISIVIRWLVLPRSSSLSRAFPLFITGLALAEACGLLGIFLGGAYREQLFLLGVLGIVQYLPFFARQYLLPKAEGFRAKN
jgi:F0F1-type ATP synthase membrane subunit c/vacuolar-type H+-ATPase subunit K